MRLLLVEQLIIRNTKSSEIFIELVPRRNQHILTMNQSRSELSKFRISYFNKNTLHHLIDSAILGLGKVKHHSLWIKVGHKYKVTTCNLSS